VLFHLSLTIGVHACFGLISHPFLLILPIIGVFRCKNLNLITSTFMFSILIDQDMVDRTVELTLGSQSGWISERACGSLHTKSFYSLYFNVYSRYTGAENDCGRKCFDSQ
jgi:hypothetical protein